MARWNTYKSKLRHLDPHFEVDDVDPTHARIVQHSKCSKEIVMSVPYDISQFKEHTKTCRKSSSASSNTSTLHAMFTKQMQQQTSIKTSIPVHPGSKQSQQNASVFLPCPGLTELDDVWIRQYLERTEAGSAGGISERTLADDTYHSPFGTLDAFQKQAITLRQIQTHRWRLDHPRNRVFAIGSDGCLEDVLAKTDTESGLPIKKLEPCVNCHALLSLQAFKSAISKPIPKDKDHASVLLPA